MRKPDNLPPYCGVVKKSRSLNSLDPSGPAWPVTGVLYLFNSKSVVISAVDLEVEGTEFEFYIAIKLHVTSEMIALFEDTCAVGSSFNGSCPS